MMTETKHRTDSLVLSYGAEDPSEIVSLALQGRSKICVDNTLPRPHLKNYTGFVIAVVVANYLFSYH